MKNGVLCYRLNSYDVRFLHLRWSSVARIGQKRNAYRLLVGKPEGKRPLGTPRRRWMDNIRMDL
jgi:hypothetical protein